MAIKKVQIIPPNYTDIIHPETQADITTYSNSNSGLIATNVQLAIDEIDTKVDTNKTDILTLNTTVGSVAMTTTAQNVKDAINEHETQINVLDAKTKPVYSKAYTGTLSSLDNIASNVFGLNAASTIETIFKVLVNESAVPYLFGGSKYEIEEYMSSNLYKVQIAKTYGIGGIKTRICSNGTWTEWYTIATTAQPSWITATLQSGWTGTFQYRKNQIGQLEFHFSLTAGTVANGTAILTLPSGYYPIQAMQISAYNATDDVLGSSFVMRTDGILIVRTGGNIETGKVYSGGGIVIC